MTTKHAYVLSGLVLLTGALLLGKVTAQEAAPATGTRVAVCDIATVFNNYTRAKDLTTELENKRRGLAEEDQRRNTVLETLQGNLDNLNPGSEAYESKLSELEKQALELKIWREYEEKKLLRGHRNLTEQMYREIVQVVEEQGVALGYELVLYRDNLDLRSATTPELLSKIAQRKVLYNAPGIDITDAVLARLNQKYKDPQ